MVRVLIVDDEPAQARLTAEAVRAAGHETLTVESGSAALDTLRADRSVAVLVLDLVMPDLDGLGVLEQMRKEGISVPTIISATGMSAEGVLSIMRLGATDYFEKPARQDRLTMCLHNAIKVHTLETLLVGERHERTGTLTLADMVLDGEAMQRVAKLAQKAARSAIPVLIEGEPGVGKQLLARAIAGMGDRAGRAFVAFNCGAVPAKSLEAALFGQKRNGAPDLPGKLREANGGTLYLDEIADIPPNVQEKLLRFLENGEISPPGAQRKERVNVRLIAGSNRRLLNAAKAGHFREDLYYRLHVLPIYMPPLRDRREQISPLASHFMTRIVAETGKQVIGLAPEARDLLESYDWPGNVAQLEVAISRAVALSQHGVLEPADFPQILALIAGPDHLRAALAARPDPDMPVHIDNAPPRNPARVENAPDRFLNAEGELSSLAELERALIIFAIEHHQGRMSRVARALKIGRSTLYRKLHEYGLEELMDRDAA